MSLDTLRNCDDLFGVYAFASEGAVSVCLEARGIFKPRFFFLPPKRKFSDTGMFFGSPDDANG